MARRVAFVTIGQSPRPDVVPELLDETRTPITVTERGVLDGLSRAEIRAIAPGPGEERLVSRLADGTEVILGKPAIQARLRETFAELDEQGFDLIVLLCTGHFDTFRMRTAFLEPQQVVDNFVLGPTNGVERLGILLPNRQQIEEFHGIAGRTTSFAYASPYRDDDGIGELRAASDALADAGAIVMHCMGYSEAMRRAVMERVRCPVLLPRRIVAHAIDLLLS